MMKNLWMTVILLSMTVLSYGQYTVTGIVKDAQSGELMPGANVTLNSRVQATDENGKFEFQNVANGKVMLRVSFVGYHDLDKQVNVTEDVQLTFSLTEDVLMNDEVIVSATRAGEKTPTTFTTMSKAEIEENNLGQDLPYLLNQTPSVVTTSDAGAGIGYTGIRIRGSDATRVNVTINGVPYNDSESQGNFWVNIPDIASSTQSIQVQRGVGTSTNGAGAFGGTINLQTLARKTDPYAELINSTGSYNTWRHTLNFGTGLIDDHWTFDGRLSKITSDGYVDRATSDLSAYYLSGGYYGEKTIVKAIMFGGKERTYQSWYGTPEAILKNDSEGIEAVIANNGVSEEQAENLRNSGRTFNWYRYDDEVDDYTQDHYQLHVSQQLSSYFTGNMTLHYTYGRGHFEQFREDDDFADYGLPNVVLGDTTITSSDFIRKRWLDNDFYGATYAFEYDKDKVTATLGGGYNEYRGDHFGEIIWATYAVDAFNGDHYYDGTGIKKDFNTYLKVNYQLSNTLNIFGDLQYRSIHYTIDGIDSDLRPLDFKSNYQFFNPKFGIVYTLNDASNLYASYSVGNREPVRGDFIDSPAVPTHETLYNLEVGYRLAKSKYNFSANYYLMDYKNQLVLTGALNDVGSGVKTNVADSYRMGVELAGRVSLSEQLHWQANVTISKNKIKTFTEVLYDYGAAFDEYHVIENVYEDTDIAFSPNVIAGSQLSYLPAKGFEISLLSKYVGKQYLDNTANDNRVIGACFVNDFRLRYAITTNLFREIGVTLQVNNIFNELYSSNGYTFGYFGGANYEVRENYYYPQAPRHFMASLVLKF